MPATDELSAHASSSVDFYALLGITPTAVDSEIRSAFRKSTLKYHPDKVGDSPENVEKFLLIKVAQDVLSDPRIRALYDQSREARERKKAETEKLEAGRRKMVSELERRENVANNLAGIGAMGVKRSRSGDQETPEQKLEREIYRISQENRRKKEELLAKRDRERLEEEERRADEDEARERIKRAKELKSSKASKTATKNFPLEEKWQSPKRKPAETLHSRENTSQFEQTVLQRLRTAQREKERKKQSSAETSHEHG